MNTRKRIATLAMTLLLLLAQPVLARSVSSTVGGAATDATGAVIPGAIVTLTNRNTGVSQHGTTDSAGNYSFPSVPLGLYDLTVEKPGFATYKLANFNVVVGQRVRKT